MHFKEKYSLFNFINYNHWLPISESSSSGRLDVGCFPSRRLGAVD